MVITLAVLLLVLVLGGLGFAVHALWWAALVALLAWLLAVALRSGAPTGARGRRGRR